MLKPNEQECIATLEHPEEVQTVAFDPTGEKVVTLMFNGMHIWNIDTNTIITKCATPSHPGVPFMILSWHQNSIVAINTDGEAYIAEEQSNIKSTSTLLETEYEKPS